MTQQPHEKQGGAAARRVGGPVIAFRCPNGHVGQVPAHLAGKKARCPQCKIPMTIPVPPGTQIAVNPLHDNPLAGNPFDDNPLVADPLEPHALDALMPTEAAVADELPLLEPEPLEVQGEPQFPVSGPNDAPWHPTADLVARLWAEREHGGAVEVHHADGVIMPDWYDVTWSRGTHGVFGSQAPDGTVTITAVAWSAVQKVIVRQVQTLPADMFLNS